MKLIKNVFCLFALLPLIAAAQPVWIDDGLVAYYPFDGDAKDASGNGNDGEVNGATLVEDRFGDTSKAYSFSGSGSNFKTPQISNIKAISFHAFVGDVWPFRHGSPNPALLLSRRQWR